ncbi:DUF488 domain-containing protein [Nocardia sp. NPDC127526]|uniref:DUF488 domain-containing protein n=1 Tax=Nocardia sp. NPDC127526 TaxID=3345393 RepID=UPI0036303799
MNRITTIGVYGFTAETFLHQLITEGVDLLLDLRQRRGVRGPDYSWANATRLQQSLTTANITYRHIKPLAPTTDLRHLQYREDARQGVGKRTRTALSPAYITRYTQEILTPFNLPALLSTLPPTSTFALFCVERDPEACHRSLVAARLSTATARPVTNLRPT